MILAMQRKIADDEKKADVHQLKAVEDKDKGKRHISFIGNKANDDKDDEEADDLESIRLILKNRQ